MALKSLLPKKIRELLCRVFQHQQRLLVNEKQALYWCPFCGQVGYFSMFDLGELKWRQPDPDEMKFIERFERQ